MLRKRFYVAVVVQDAHEKFLSCICDGMDVIDAERREMSDTLALGFRNGATLHHIVKAYSALSPLFHVSKCTFYTQYEVGHPDTDRQSDLLMRRR